MEVSPGDVSVHFSQHGEGLPLLILHGAEVDHRGVEACFEPAFENPGPRSRRSPTLVRISRAQEAS